MYLSGLFWHLLGLNKFLIKILPKNPLLILNEKLFIVALKYLEKRFDNKVRIVAAVIFMIEMFAYMAVVLYSPSLAIQQGSWLI